MRNRGAGGGRTWGWAAVAALVVLLAVSGPALIGDRLPALPREGGDESGGRGGRDKRVPPVPYEPPPLFDEDGRVLMILALLSVCAAAAYLWWRHRRLTADVEVDFASAFDVSPAALASRVEGARRRLASDAPTGGGVRSQIIAAWAQIAAAYDGDVHGAANQSVRQRAAGIAELHRLDAGSREHLGVLVEVVHSVKFSPAREASQHELKSARSSVDGLLSTLQAKART